jgi:hypothetical protein
MRQIDTNPAIIVLLLLVKPRVSDLCTTWVNLITNTLCLMGDLHICHVLFCTLQFLKLSMANVQQSCVMLLFGTTLFHSLQEKWWCWAYEHNHHLQGSQLHVVKWGFCVGGLGLPKGATPSGLVYKATNSNYRYQGNKIKLINDFLCHWKSAKNSSFTRLINVCSCGSIESTTRSHSCMIWLGRVNQYLSFHVINPGIIRGEPHQFCLDSCLWPCIDEKNIFGVALYSRTDELYY